MMNRIVASGILSVALVMSVTWPAYSASSSYRPALCYLRADNGVKGLPSFKGWAIDIRAFRDCPGLGAFSSSDASQLSRYIRKIKQVRDRHARKIQQLGYLQAPRSVYVTLGRGCGGGIRPNTRATIRQKGFELQLRLPQVTLRGAIVQKYVVFVLMDINNIPIMDFQAALGELNKGTIALRSEDGSCRITIRER